MRARTKGLIQPSTTIYRPYCEGIRVILNSSGFELEYHETRATRQIRIPRGHIGTINDRIKIQNGQCTQVYVTWEDHRRWHPNICGLRTPYPHTDCLVCELRKNAVVDLSSLSVVKPLPSGTDEFLKKNSLSFTDLGSLISDILRLNPPLVMWTH